VPVDKYLAAKQKRNEAITSTVEAGKVAYKESFTTLLNDPDARNPQIGLWLAGYLMNQMAAELGNEDLAVSYWYNVAADAGSMSLDELNSIPQNMRGDVWTTTRKVLVAWCDLQAQIESGFLTEIFSSLAKTDPMLKGAIKELDKSDIKQLVKDGVPRG